MPGGLIEAADTRRAAGRPG